MDVSDMPAGWKAAMGAFLRARREGLDPIVDPRGRVLMALNPGQEMPPWIGESGVSNEDLAVVVLGWRKREAMCGPVAPEMVAELEARCLPSLGRGN
ncbi:MAG: hypothetical protein QG615_1767 [Nitrospirota bacterium]|nr:hypothetical protein [Nitrospirota bacterium]